MVLILDGNSGPGALLWSEIGHLICLRHLFKSTEVANLKYIFQRRYCQHLRNLFAASYYSYYKYHGVSDKHIFIEQ